MAENGFAGLSEAEDRIRAGGQPDDANKPDGAAAPAPAPAADDRPNEAVSAEDRIAAGMALDPHAPTDEQAADTIATRSPEAEAPAQFEEVIPMAPALGSEAFANVPGSAPHVLNATPGVDPAVPPNLATQHTGPHADPVYRAPAMTRGSAINQLEVRWGELVTMLHDFDHDVAGLPDDLGALVDFVKSRSAPRA